MLSEILIIGPGYIAGVALLSASASSSRIAVDWLGK